MKLSLAKIIGIILIVALPLFIWIIRQTTYVPSSANILPLGSVHINPEVIDTDINEPSTYLSALAYDTGGLPIWSGVTYQWGISTTNSIGTLSANSDDKLATFTPSIINRGRGDIFVIAFMGSEQVTRSIPVYVGVTPTPTPTVTPTPTNVPTHTPTPTAKENASPLCNGLSVSPSSGNTPLTVSFICAGSDSDNDVTAAEFDFGNGIKKLVEKSIGQFGSIITTYTYQTAGTYTVTCRVRDNIQKFSSIPDICRRSVVVKASTSTTQTASSSAGNSFDPVVYTGVEEVILQPSVTATATPTLKTTPTPILPASAKGDNKLFQIGTMLLVSIITIAAGLILRRMMGGPDL